MSGKTGIGERRVRVAWPQIPPGSTAGPLQPSGRVLFIVLSRCLALRQPLLPLTTQKFNTFRAVFAAHKTDRMRGRQSLVRLNVTPA